MEEQHKQKNGANSSYGIRGAVEATTKAINRLTYLFLSTIPEIRRQKTKIYIFLNERVVSQLL